jgi:large subunit ribosomal protein L21
VTDTYTEIEEERIDTTPVTPPPYIPPAPDMVPPAPPEMVQHIAGDDFTLLNGISMRITEALNNAGIETFEQLAMSDPENLRTILQNAGFRLTDPTSWHEQARLAASGDMDALREYQRRLNDSGMV